MDVMLDQTPAFDASLEEWEEYAERLQPLVERNDFAKFMYTRACDTISTLRSVQEGKGLERLKDMLGMQSVEHMMTTLYATANRNLKGGIVDNQQDGDSRSPGSRQRISHPSQGRLPKTR